MMNESVYPLIDESIAHSALALRAIDKARAQPGA